ncbi:MAG: energy transducer TonB [Bacteroidia bacterium]|nr:energy transducer TonB [Bacteroidales bacterium]NCD40679.1 energy transducer TonB [Bacteroidia bacterium]HPE86232.1 energy transducer TonB [Bacteroidales bacterium]
MEAKKSPKANLEDKRTIFIEIGLIIALAVVLLAFEWKKYDIEVAQLGAREAIEQVEEIIINTKQEVKPPPPKPPPTTTVLNIVEDDVEIEDELIIDVEADEALEIEEYIPIEVEEEEVVEEEIFLVVENQPEFPGGEAARLKYLSENIEYPQMAKESGIQGIVYVTFVVEPNGSISNVAILRGIGGGCDEEAVRVVQNMPSWKPGKQRGRPVRVRFNMPIKFTLQ